MAFVTFVKLAEIVASGNMVDLRELSQFPQFSGLIHALIKHDYFITSFAKMLTPSLIYRELFSNLFHPLFVFKRVFPQIAMFQICPNCSHHESKEREEEKKIKYQQLAQAMITLQTFRLSLSNEPVVEKVPIFFSSKKSIFLYFGAFL